MFYSPLAGCKEHLSSDLCICVHCSSGMKRLPFSDEEFGSPPNKMPRVDEPKKGTARVCVVRVCMDVCVAAVQCFYCSHADQGSCSDALLWGSM